MTTALAKRMLVPDGQASRQAEAFECFQNVASLNELLDLDGGEPLVYAAVLLYPDLFV